MWLALIIVASDPFVESLLSAKPDPLGPGGMRFYALSFAAQALANEGQPSTALAKAMATPRYRKHFTGTTSNARAGESAIYAGHVLLAQLRAGVPDHALALDLAQHVKPGQLLASYAQHPRRLWPADNEVALAALKLYAAAYPEVDEVRVAGEQLERTLDALMADKLPPSELDPVTHKQKTPRGCALGLSVVFRAMHDPEQAAALYAMFREDFFQVAGFREWPNGVDGAADLDSGPIVLGIGASASAFGLAAAKAVHADFDHALLSKSSLVAMRVVLSEKERDSQLAGAILRFAK